MAYNKSNGSNRGTGSSDKKTFGSRKPSGEWKSGDRKPSTGGYGERKTYGKSYDKSYSAKKSYGGIAAERSVKSVQVREDEETALYNSNGKKLDKNLGKVKDESTLVYENMKHGKENGGDGNDEIRDDLIEGRNPVTEALEAGRSINRILVSRGLRDSSIGKIINLAKEKNIPVAETDKDLMDKMSVVGSHQGVIALASPKEYCEVDDILEISKQRGTKPFIIILDNLNDPHNFGAVIRCAECAGADGIIIPQRRSVAVTPVVAKVSAGAVEHMPIARVVNISQAIEDLKGKGLWIVGTDGSGTQSYKECDYDMPLALVIGSEGSGMSRLVTEKCDYLVNIPMMGKVNSLNAAMASAIVMFEIVTQRKAKQ